MRDNIILYRSVGKTREREELDSDDNDGDSSPIPNHARQRHRTDEDSETEQDSLMDIEDAMKAMTVEESPTKQVSTDNREYHETAMNNKIIQLDLAHSKKSYEIFRHRILPKLVVVKNTAEKPKIIEAYEYDPIQEKMIYKEVDNFDPSNYDSIKEKETQGSLSRSSGQGPSRQLNFYE